MPYQTGAATDYRDLLQQLKRFVAGYGTAAAPTYAGTGNGTMTGIDTHPATVTETWTVQCTDATTAGAEVWSVTGSVSATKANATTGVAYDNGLLAFTIAAGATNFAVGDKFTVATTQGALSAAGQAWTVMAESDAGGDGNLDLYLKAPGLAGTDEIYTQIRAYGDVSNDYYNWELRGSVGYLASAAFDAQPNVSPATYIHLWKSAIPYWMVASGRRLVLVTKISTIYEAAYLGYILPYATPGQYPYPLMIGGTSSNATGRWSATDENHRHFTDPGRYGNRMRLLDGTWQGFSNFYDQGSERYDDASGKYIWPYAPSENEALLRTLRENVDGGYTLLPLILAMNDPANNLLGEMDGCYWVSGSGNAAENLITIAGVDHLAVQNVFRTGRQYYWALRLS